MQSNFQPHPNRSGDGFSSNINIRTPEEKKFSFHPKFSSQSRSAEPESSSFNNENHNQKEKPQKMVSVLDGIITTSLVALFFWNACFFHRTDFSRFEFWKAIVFLFLDSYRLGCLVFKGCNNWRDEDQKNPLGFSFDFLCGCLCHCNILFAW